MAKRRFRKAFYMLAISGCLSFALKSNAQQAPVQDTLSLTLQQAEERFLDSNFLLLAQKYNIDVQRAYIIQAKLWPNPNFGIGHAIYSGGVHQFFPTGVNDETNASLSQLILLARKRNKQIKLAEAGTQIAQYEFYDLIRTLKYQLRTNFFNIYYLQQSAKAYNEEIISLQKVVTAFNQQEGKGYIAEREVVRVKAQLYSLQTEYNDLINQINDNESQLRLTLEARQFIYIKPAVDTVTVAMLSPSAYALSTLLDSAFANRTDLLIAKGNTNLNSLNYNYQKALATPDLTLGADYDEQGGFSTNYYGLNASMDLPFFNRNQGNIKAAKASIDITKAIQTNVQDTVQESVTRALQKAFDQDKLYKNIDSSFTTDFERLMQGVLSNYEKRNIGLLDFLDFYDSYKQNILQINNVKYNRIQAFEDLNYYTGTNFFNEK